MKRLLLFTVILLTALHGFSEQTTKHSRVKVYASKNTHFEKLMKLGLSLESLESKKDAYFIGEFSAHDIERIKESGVEFEILIDDISAFYVNRNKGIDVDALNEALKSNKRNYNGVTTPSNFKLGSFGGYHNHNEMLAELDEMHSLFPDLISVKAPASTTTTIEGRPIYMVRISNNPEIDQDKPKVLYTGLIHAREPAGMQQMLFQMWYLLENYATNPEIEYLVNNLELFFIPCVNPDGYIHNQNTDPNGGGMWRKNKRMNAGGSVGVDLNRNFGYMWGYNNSGSSTDGNSMTYRGTSGFSEPETQVIKEVCESRAFSLALNNHTYSDILIYPFGYDNVLTPDSSIFIEYAKRMTQANGYAYGTCYQTLNYTSNGGSDDWFYGEQTTKNKILAFTPEAGSPSEGFWPQANKIEEICSGHTEMNLYIMRFALPYAEITDNSGRFISSMDYNFHYSLLPLGNVELSNFTVWMEPISDNILSVGNEQTFSNLEKLEETQGNALITLKPNTPQGEVVKWVTHVSNGAFTSTDTITKHYGEINLLAYDNCETMDNWTSSTWNTTTNAYFSAPKSITDSPNGNYANYANTHITYNQSIDLTSAIMANVEFMAKWELESNYDYVQFLVSENGSTWIPMTGKHTTIGNHSTNQPLYDGTKDWIAEEIDLSQFIGKQIQVRFALRSDAGVNKDGFYFDDFKISTLTAQTSPTLNLPAQLSFERGTILNVNIADYVATNMPMDNMEFTWTGNQYINISITDWELAISSTDNAWLGEETIKFSLDYSSGTVETDVIIEVKAPSAITETENNSILIFYNPESNIIEIQNAEKFIQKDFQIISIFGRIERQEQIKTANSKLNVGNLAKGVYIIRLSNERSTKFVVY